jgi:hypothetical protein
MRVLVPLLDNYTLRNPYRNWQHIRLIFDTSVIYLPLKFNEAVSPASSSASYRYKKSKVVGEIGRLCEVLSVVCSIAM